jgi:aspartate ammonia-lyase
VAAPILRAGTDDQKREWLPRIAGGEVLGCYALTEPEAGSDTAALGTRAVPEGDGYRITGAKQWISNGALADVFVIFARTGVEGARGVSAFVASGGDGLTAGPPERKMGLHTSSTVQLYFDAFPVTPDRLVGAEDEGLHLALAQKGVEFDDIVKAGRTHLQDAMPIRLGQEFTAYAGTLVRARKRVLEAADYLNDLGIGGSAVGTGVTVEPDYPARMNAHLRSITGITTLRIGRDRIQLMQSMGDAAAFSASLRGLALDLSKIASDLRLMASGPRTGLDEIALPAVQPGSSMMPGKINPSIPEMVNQVCFQVIGCDTTVAIAAEHGQLELNVMMPVIAQNVLLSMQILTNAIDVFATRCVVGIAANAAMCHYWVERSAALATALMPQIGYAAAAEIAKRSVREGTLIRELVAREGVVPLGELDAILDLHKMTEIGVPSGTHGSVAGG